MNGAREILGSGDPFLDFRQRRHAAHDFLGFLAQTAENLQ
jgi:hypothetical protein